MVPSCAHALGSEPLSYEQITCESREDILLITLNRPDKLNAYTS